jgi:peptidoglycan/LPS O-acetylase OafA/YrhL
MIATYAQFRGVRFFGSLDGLRAFSIMGVLWFHCWWGTSYYPKLTAMPVLRHGEYGVQVFYVVSGFLITRLLLRERERFGKISLRDFYIRRTLRIWPLYYTVVALYVFVVRVFEHDASRAASFFHYRPTFLTYTYPWFLTPKWPGGTFNLAGTLATEEQFCAFRPLVNRVFRGVGVPLVMVGLILLQTLTGHGWLARWLLWDWLPTRIILSIAVPICLGAILAHALHSEKIFRVLYPLLGCVAGLDGQRHSDRSLRGSRGSRPGRRVVLAAARVYWGDQLRNVPVEFAIDPPGAGSVGPARSATSSAGVPVRAGRDGWSGLSQLSLF